MGKGKPANTLDISMLERLIKLADQLDRLGLSEDADLLDALIESTSEVIEGASQGGSPDCEERLGDELGYFDNLSKMHKGSPDTQETEDT